MEVYFIVYKFVCKYMDKKLLEPYVFKYNSFQDVWYATKREHYTELHSGDKGNTLKSANINTLVELISRTGGDPLQIDKLVDSHFTSDPQF